MARRSKAPAKKTTVVPANKPKQDNEGSKLRKVGASVVPPESESGPIEYKRQVHNPTPARLRSLATQMSYRLDQGNGTCTYRLGVEDDGRHSLLDYSNIVESVRVLECIARSLNAIVIEQRMIQNEATNGEQKAKDEDEKEEKSENNQNDIDKTLPMRCEVVLQRVETHLLEDSPASLNDLVDAVNNSKTPSKPKCTDSDPPPASSNSPPSKTTTPTPKATIEETLSSRNIRIAVVGNVDAGKSTLIGTLTTSSLDDGRGKSRTAIMKHRHEIESGRTSTATSHLLGFKSTGEPIKGRDSLRANKRKTEDEVARESHRIVTLIDLAGHEKYLKTTIHGVSSGMADYSLILVNSRHPPTHMTQHHLNLCCSFGIPVVVVFTKIDGCPEHAKKNSKEMVTKLLRAPDIGKKPFMVRNEQDIATCMGKLQTLAPMIDTSCVTGEGMDLLQKMLFTLPKRRRHDNKVNRPFEFLVEDIFNVPGVGAVVSGFVNAGELTVGSTSQVYVGPTDDGSFLKTVAKSAHIARINTSHVTSGQSACLAFSLKKELREKLRRGMVVLKENPTSTKEFDAEICVLKGEGTTIRRSYQAYVHILNVRQSAFAKNIELVNNHVVGLPPSHRGSVDLTDDDDNCMGEEEDGNVGIVLRPGSRAKVRFEFAKRPEYIRPGMRMLFRDGRVRGVGIITGIPKCVSPVS